MAYLKSDVVGMRILRHIKKYGETPLHGFLDCNDAQCCDGEMTYGRFHNGRRWIGHVHQFAQDEPFICHWKGGQWVYDLPKYWNEATLYALWLLAHLATRAEGFHATATAINNKWSADSTLNMAVKTVMALLQHDGDRIQRDIEFVKKTLQTIA